MHNALAVLYSIFFVFASSATAFLPSFLSSESPSSAPQPFVADKCTFTAFHKQLITASSKNNYIQINEIKDNANDVIVDVAAARPATARNSYARISADQVFAIKGLLDDSSLIVREGKNDDEVQFENDGIFFTSVTENNTKEAYCESSMWNKDMAKGEVGSRERKLICAFPCSIMEEDEQDVSNSELR